MKELARVCLYVIAIAIAIVLLGCGYLHLKAKKMTACNVHAGDEDILIFAPHPDDGVIIAGGYALQTKKNGGEVTVVFLTGDSARLEEAFNAWSLIGLKMEDLIRAEADDQEGHLTLDDVSHKIEAIAKIITSIDPDIVFVPLYEGGHIEHDRTNYLVSRAVKSLATNVRLYECPEYNFYFSLRNTPEKIVDGISKLIPLFEYHAPPSFIDPKGGFYLCMTKGEIATKKQMLNQFGSQSPEILTMHFGFNDRFRPYTEHEYHLPPHDYGNRLIYAIRYSRVKVLRRLFSKPMWKPLTVHTAKDRRPLGPLLTENRNEEG